MSTLSSVATAPRSIASSQLSTRPGTLSLIKLLLCAFLHFGVTKALPFVSVLKEDEGKPADDPQLWAFLGTAVALVLLGGAFAGLTIALMGQDEVYLQVLAESGEGSEKRNAKKVLKLLGRGKHWVLVTLLVGNVITNETLPIVLDRSIGGGYAAAISSTVLVIIFGEIVPQSICVRYGLSIGAWMAPFVLGLMWLLAIVCWPIAKLLDYLLGKDHGTTYKKAGLKTLVTLHRTLGDGGERLNADEVNIISGVLDLKAKSVGSIMTPMSDVFTLSSDAILDEEMMNTIMSEGYSRIPIHDPKNKRDFVGMLLVKMLITYDPEDAKAVNTFSLATLPETAPETSCLDIINFFQEGKSHMVLVSDFPGEAHGALGVVTLEDVIEELIGEEIIDESDVYVDIHKAIRRTPAPTHRAHVHRVDVAQDTDATLVSDSDAHEGTDENKDANELNARLSAPLRRKSSTSGSVSAQSMQRRNYTPELRAQFKHLGPSNSARKPKLTRVNTVKIKPGVGTIPENTALTQHANSAAPPSQNGSSQPLLAPTPGNQFPTGHASLQAGYGTWDAPETTQLPPTDLTRHHIESGDVTTESEALSAAVDSNQLPPPSPAIERPPKIIIERNDSNSTLGSLNSHHSDQDDDENSNVGISSRRGQTHSASRHHKRTSTRSGSITENIVDAGGVKKLVLGTMSSPSGSDDEGENAIIEAASNGRLAAADGEDDAAGNAQDGSTDGKKRRRKRGKKTKGEENQPLLGRGDS